MSEASAPLPPPYSILQPLSSDATTPPAEPRARYTGHPIGWFCAGSALLLLTSALAYLQRPAGDPYRPAASAARAWLTRPLESNAWRRLPGAFTAAALSTSGVDHVWVVGSHGTILRSTDGGETWKLQPSTTDASLSSVQFLDQKRGWATGQGGILLSTSDGGAHWIHRTITERDLTTLCFADANRGWAGDLSGAILATSDGGAHWNAVYKGSAKIASIHSIDGRRGWAISGQSILKTANAGTTWQVASSFSSELLSLFFVDAQHGWATGSNNTILATVDGGSTWQAQNLNDGSPYASLNSTRSYRDIYFVDTLHGWAASDAGIVLGTADGGLTWHRSVDSDGDVLFAIHFANPLRGWAVGLRGHVITTSDGGAHWRALASGTREGLSAVHFVGPDRAWTVGRRGTVLATTDGGSTWHPQSSGTDQGLNGVYFTDAQHGWSVGDWNSIVATTNGGRAWHTQEPQRLALFLPSVHFLDSNLGWAVGSDGLRSTRNGGVTWTSSDPFLIPGALFYTAVQFLDEKEGWILDGRALYRTDDGAKTWTQGYDSGGEELSSAFFVDREHGWAVGSDGAIVATSNAGRTWQLQASHTSAPLRSVFFLDTRRGWVAGQLGTILATSDAGATWERQPSGTTQSLTSIHFGDSRHGAAVSEEGTIFVTADGGHTWSLPPYRSWPAPWYYFLLPAVALMWTRAWRQNRAVYLPQRSAADYLISDNPIGDTDFDALGLRDIASGLSQFVRNINTLPPVTIAITAPWGFGKSSLMRLIEADLRRNRVRPVWFNAWHHQTEEDMLAYLLEAIREQAVPSWLSITGFRFRLRLLWLRGPRYTLPVLALAALFAFAVALLAGDDAPGRLAAISRGVSKISSHVTGASPEAGRGHVDAGPSTGAAIGIGLTAISAFLGLLSVLGKILKSFGVKTSALMKASVAGVRMQSLKGRPSARMQFQRQFAEVTRALAPHRMVIFIDDLDRCHPDRVTKTLEAVNFLVSAGECFVFLGIAPEVVEASVGLGFAKIAAEMSSDVADSDGMAHRRAFARAYLGKLVNMEVAVPEISAAQAESLLLNDRLRTAPLSYVDGMRKWLRINSFLFLFPMIVAAASLAVEAARSVPATEPAAAKTPEPRSSPVLAVVPPPQLVGRSLPPPPQGAIGPTIRPAPADRWRWAFVFGPSLIPLLIVCYWVLTRRPDAVIIDSPGFTEALRIWALPIARHSRTPRELKRAQNYLRYLAMRVRQPIETRTPLERLLGLLERRLGSSPKPASVPQEARNASAAPPTVDETNLVAMAALSGYVRSDDIPDYEILARAHHELRWSTDEHKRVFERLPTARDWERYHLAVARSPEGGRRSSDLGSVDVQGS